MRAESRTDAIMLPLVTGMMACDPHLPAEDTAAGRRSDLLRIAIYSVPSVYDAVARWTTFGCFSLQSLAALERSDRGQKK
jgi:hypothetical protein